MLNNPILRKEMTSIIRSWKTYLIITIYLFFLVAISRIMLTVTSKNAGAAIGRPVEVYTTGLMFVTFVQMIIISFIAPSAASSAISGERQRGTFDLLVCTRMSPFEIFSGKLLGALSYVVILLTVSLPITAMFIFATGIDVAPVVMIFAYQIVVGLYFASFAMLMSSIFSKTITASVGSLAFMIVSYVGVPIVYALLATIFSEAFGLENTDLLSNIMYLNPVTGVVDIFRAFMGGDAIFVKNAMGSVDYGHTLVCMAIMLGFTALFSKLTVGRIDPARSKRSVD